MTVCYSNTAPSTKILSQSKELQVSSQFTQQLKYALTN